MLQTYTARTTVIEEVAARIYRFEFALEGSKSISFVPGQYMLLNIPEGYRQYSISSPPIQTSQLEIVADVAPMGSGSRYLLSLKKNSLITFRAPLGVFMLQQTTMPKFFLATGTGVAPMKSMILDLITHDFQEDYHLVWGLRTHDDVYFKREFAQLGEQNPKFHHHICFSQDDPQDNTELKGYVQHALRILHPDNYGLEKYEWYLCGRPQTVDSIRQSLINDFDVSSVNIYNEKFT